MGGHQSLIHAQWASFRLAILVLALGVILPAQLQAQATSESSVASGPGSAYGMGAQSALEFEGESAPNLLQISFGASALYDDNVYALNTNRVGDEALAFDGHFGAEKSNSNLRFSFDYTPVFLLYRQISQYDRLNHAANLNLAFRISPRVIMSLHDSAGYQNGVFPGLVNQPILSGPTPPTAPNQGVYGYTTRDLFDTTGLDLTFVKSRRQSLTVSVSYNLTRYGNQSGDVASLYDSWAVNGGVQYQYRATTHTTLGVLVLHQDNTFSGGAIFGSRLRDQIETEYTSLGARLSPTLSVVVYGGPQYVHVLGAPGGDSTVASNVQGAFGASATKQANSTAFDISFDRSVTDSGGLYTSVISTDLSFGVRRRLIGRWNGTLRGNLYRINADLFQAATGVTDAATAGVLISRPLGDRTRFHIAYDTFHQLSSGNVSYFQTFDRNQISVGFDFVVKGASLGQ